MLSKVFISFPVLVFFLVSVFVLPAISEDVTPKTEESTSKDTVKENSNMREIGIDLPVAPSGVPVAPSGGNKALDNIHTAFNINCAAGNVLACIPSAGVDIAKALGWIFKDKKAEEKQMSKQWAIIEATKDSCINVMGDKDKADLFYKDTNSGKDYRIECVRTFYCPDKKCVQIKMIYYQNDVFINETAIGGRIAMEKDKAIAKKKCLQVIDKEEQGEVEYGDSEMGINYKFSWSKELVGEDKFPVVKILITKNDKPAGVVYYPLLKKNAGK